MDRPFAWASRHRLFLPKALIGELGSRSPTPPSFVPEETVGSSGTPITGRDSLRTPFEGQGWENDALCPHFACLLARLEGFDPRHHGFEGR